MTHRRPTSPDELQGWFAGRIPADWFGGAPTVDADRDEILVVGTLAEPELPADASSDAVAAARASRIAGFREDTRGQRMAIADEAQRRFDRKVSWGVRVGDHQALFTHVAAPVMTRLRQPQRQVLDTLVDAGVARSRADALAWCVRLVGQHEDDWLGELREAMSSVADVRAKGPAA